MSATTVRDVIGHFAGRTVVDVLDCADGEETITLLFDDASYLIIPITADGVTWGHPDLWTLEPDGWY